MIVSHNNNSFQKGKRGKLAAGGKINMKKINKNGDLKRGGGS